MKRFLMILIPLLSLSALYSQDFNETETEHYLIRSTRSPEETAHRGLIMEGLYSRFSEFIGNPVNDFPPLTVTELYGKDEYLSYLGVGAEMKEGSFLLIRQGMSGNSEILFYQGEDEATGHRALIHLALFQYLEACNRDTPFWIKAGLARYFETIPLDSQTADPVPFNWSAWEEWYALSKNEIPSLNDLLFLEGDSEVSDRNLHTLAWAYVTYLLNAQGEEGRMLWETLSLIRTNRKDEWTDSVNDSTEEGCRTYLASLQRPESHGTVLRKLYKTASRNEVLSYIEDWDLSENWLGYYYRGLIHYDRGLFDDGLSDFIKAESTGAPRADVWYSQALCLWELNRQSEAKTLLKKAEGLREGIIPTELSRLLD